MKLTGQRCQCTTCGEYFNRVSTFDKHRVGEFEPASTRRCLSTAEMDAREWRKNEKGFWLTKARDWSHA